MRVEKLEGRKGGEILPYKIRYKSSNGRWYDHTYRYSDRPILYKTKEGALKAMKKHSFRLVYQNTVFRIVKVRRKKKRR